MLLRNRDICPNAGHHLLDLERARDVIDATRLKAIDFVVEFAPRADEHNRNRGLMAGSAFRRRQASNPLRRGMLISIRMRSGLPSAQAPPPPVHHGPHRWYSLHPASSFNQNCHVGGRIIDNKDHASGLSHAYPLR